MRIERAESGEVLVANAEVARTYWQRFRGLMMRRSLPEGSALIIEPCGSIQMTFMRFPIDAVFYAQDGRITSIAHGVRPWIGVAKGGKGTLGVIEMPAGSADTLAPGEHLLFIK